MWFNPSQLEKAKSYVHHADHSLECKTVGGNEWRPFLEYDLIAQDFILRCKHRSHESVKFIFKHFADGPKSEKIQKGRLF